MPAHDETLKDIDAKIARNQELLDEAQKWLNLHNTLRNNLDVLKRARVLLERDDVIPEPDQYTHVIQEAQNAAAQPLASPIPESSGAQPISIGALIIAVLTEAGTPLSVQTIMQRVQAKGRADLNLKTLGGVISQYLAKGSLRRTARAIYALPLPEISPSTSVRKFASDEN